MPSGAESRNVPAKRSGRTGQRNLSLSTIQYSEIHISESFDKIEAIVPLYDDLPVNRIETLAGFYQAIGYDPAKQRYSVVAPVDGKL